MEDCDNMYNKTTIISISIISQQHGFVTGRLVDTNLTLCIDFILKALDQRVQVDSVCIDFRKAFDTVDHSILLVKQVK